MKLNINIRKGRLEDNGEVTTFAFELMRSLGVLKDLGTVYRVMVNLIFYSI